MIKDKQIKFRTNLAYTLYLPPLYTVNPVNLKLYRSRAGILVVIINVPALPVCCNGNEINDK